MVHADVDTTWPLAQSGGQLKRMLNWAPLEKRIKVIYPQVKSLFGMQMITLSKHWIGIGQLYSVDYRICLDTRSDCTRN